ncbi:MAG TPA: transporter [Longimicrobium sp.]|nr:transporter [Longimicrobium sp.]
MNTPYRTRLRLATAATVALLASGCATAGTPPPPVSTSRLGVAKPTGTVPRGLVQLEAGYSRARLDQRTRHAFGETMVRVGVGPRTEARVGLSSYMRTVTPATTVEGIADASASVKHRFSDALGWIPAVAVTAGATLPTGASAVSAGAWQPEGAVAAEWKLPHGLRALGMASHRAAIAADDRFGQTTLAVAGRSAIGKAGMGHLEYSRGTSTRAGAVSVGQVRAGGGLRLTPNLQLDGWAARATLGGDHEFLFGLGFAQRW